MQNVSDIKYIDIKEFRERGYLQELNRRFLHPLGMALEVRRNDDGTEELGRVWDYRDDTEGMRYTDCNLRPKYESVMHEWAERAVERLHVLGYIEQPPTDRGGPIE